MTDKKEKTLTTSAGNPIADNQNTITAGPRGPVLLQDYQLIEKLAHQNRERIPERVVHAKGWGAFGTFTVTHDITKYTKASIFSEIGKKTEMLYASEREYKETGNAVYDIGSLTDKSNYITHYKDRNARVFPGERGRGGKILKMRIYYEKETVKRYIDQRIMKNK